MTGFTNGLASLGLWSAVGWLLAAVQPAFAAGEAASDEPFFEIKARRKVQETYKVEVSRARTPQEKETLARKLIGVANKSLKDADQRNALLAEAQDLSVDAGAVTMAMVITEDRFPIRSDEILGAKRDVLKRLVNVKLTAEARELLDDHLNYTRSEAVQAERYSLARELIELHQRLTAKYPGPSVAAVNQHDQKLLADVEELEKVQEAVQSARQVLKSKPDDAKANRTVGLYVGFIQHDMQAAREHLSRAGDPLAKLLEQEEKPPEAVPALIKLGDAWMELAPQVPSIYRSDIFGHASSWYFKINLNDGTADQQKHVAQQNQIIFQGISGENVLSTPAKPDRSGAPVIKPLAPGIRPPGATPSVKPPKPLALDAPRSVKPPKPLALDAPRSVMPPKPLALDAPREERPAVKKTEGSKGSTQGPVSAKSLEGKAAGEEWSGNGLDLRFCWCPAGKFKMGSPPTEPARDNPLSKAQENQVAVTLTHGFWIARYELTQKAWESVMHTTVQQQRLKALSADSNSVGPDYPIFCVSYDESLVFCNKLTQQERDTGRLPKNWVYRLPTEAQWEYACRAGTTTATHYGSSLSSADAHILGDKPYNKGKQGPRVFEEKKVGQYKPNAWGLYDMHGNVAEWCLDCHVKSLLGGTDPLAQEDTTARIHRGGSCYSAGRSCRSAAREYSEKDDRGSGLGLRPVLVFAPEK